jgi:hypothetical protein
VPDGQDRARASQDVAEVVEVFALVLVVRPDLVLVVGQAAPLDRAREDLGGRVDRSHAGRGERERGAQDLGRGEGERRDVQAGDGEALHPAPGALGRHQRHGIQSA